MCAKLTEGHLVASGRIWSHLVAFGRIWSHLVEVQLVSRFKTLGKIFTKSSQRVNKNWSTSSSQAAARHRRIQGTGYSSFCRECLAKSPKQNENTSTPNWASTKRSKRFLRRQMLLHVPSQGSGQIFDNWALLALPRVVSQDA